MTSCHFPCLPRLMPFGVVLTLMPSILIAAPPTREIVGYSELIETGEYPQTISLSGMTGAQVAIPTPNNSFPGFGVQFDKSRDPKTVVLTLQFRQRFPSTSSLYAPGGYQWRLRDGDLTPIFGHIYRSLVSPGGQLTLTRVTEKIDERLRPQPGTRSIAMNSVNTKMFWENVPQDSRTDEFDWVKINIDAKDVATIELSPAISTSGAGTASSRKQVTTTAVAGDLLSARGRSYKVLNVVKPQDIKGLGRLVGWIEISADPVPESD